MTDQEKKRKGIAGFSAKVLNEAGTAVVDLYDFGTGVIGNAFTFSRKTTSKLPDETKSFVKKSVDYIYPDKTKNIKDRIRIKEEKIKGIYQEIGREQAEKEKSDAVDPESSDHIKKFIEDVSAYEDQIKKLEEKAKELEKEKKEAKQQKLKLKQERQEARKKAAEKNAAEKKVRDRKKKKLPAEESVRKAIESVLDSGEFTSSSEKSKFKKVAGDLLSRDQEVRILAANELAKMKNPAAVPVLTEAVNIGDSNLTSEIVNALISIGSIQAVPLFKAMVTDENYRIRIACLRGIYKLAEEDDEALQLLLNAVKDEHPDVRKSAITFIGWKDNAESVPSLVQSLRDDNNEVKKAALSALATIRDKATVLPVIRVLGDGDADIRQKALDVVKMITGEQIAFDLQASDDDLDNAVENLIEWWQKKRTGEADIPDPDDLDMEDDAEIKEEEQEELTEAEIKEEEQEGVAEAEIGEEKQEEITEAEAEIEEEKQEEITEAEIGEKKQESD